MPAESVMNFRTHLGCDTFRTEEKGTRPYLEIHYNIIKKKIGGLFPRFIYLFFFKLPLVIVDPEEFITVLFQKVLCTEPLLKLRYELEPPRTEYLTLFY